MKKKIKELMIGNTEFAIAFSIVMTIISGVLILLGVKDWSPLELALYFVILAVSMAVISNAVVLLMILFEKIKCEIKLRKLKRMNEIIINVPPVNTVCGEQLDALAFLHGIDRGEGETDEQLRARIREAIVEMNK